MSHEAAPQTELLRAAYTAFNARNIDAALATMTPDVSWPKAFKGGFVRGHQAIRAYWTEQWSEIDPHVEPVSFHREEDVRVGHWFTLRDCLIHAMEVCAGPAPNCGA